MDYKFVYTKTAISDLSKIDKPVYKRIKSKLDFFISSENPLSFAKKLTNIDNCYRFRVGDYRIIFRLDPQSQQLVILVVLNILHRKEAY